MPTPSSNFSSENFVTRDFRHFDFLQTRQTHFLLMTQRHAQRLKNSSSSFLNWQSLSSFDLSNFRMSIISLSSSRYLDFYYFGSTIFLRIIKEIKKWRLFQNCSWSECQCLQQTWATSNVSLGKQAKRTRNSFDVRQLKLMLHVKLIILDETFFEPRLEPSL